jgi:hypothetical protein
LGNEQAYAAESRLVIVLTHLLKWVYQPQRRSRGWRTSLRVGRQQIARRLRQNPSLRPELPTFLVDAYANARKRTMDEIDLPLATFPEVCPWTLIQVLAHNDHLNAGLMFADKTFGGRPFGRAYAEQRLRREQLFSGDCSHAASRGAERAISTISSAKFFNPLYDRGLSYDSMSAMGTRS